MRDSPTHWGYEFMTTHAAPCKCGGVPVNISGGFPIEYRVYCQNRCGLSTAGRESMAEAMVEWNELQQKHGFDIRLLHPLNRRKLEDYAALIKGGRATCPSSGGHDLELWEMARENVQRQLNQPTHPITGPGNQ
jgi:hypothetical protein